MHLFMISLDILKLIIILMKRMNFNNISPLLAIILLIFLVSCDPGKKYEKQEEENILMYLSNNPTLNFAQKPSGLYFLEVLAGKGSVAVAHDTAFIKYTGKFLDGTVFDSNVGTTDTLAVPVYEKWLIPGFDEGITYMKVGGKAKLIVPSNLGYGPSGYYIIAGYTPLLFDLELVRLVPGPRK